MLGNMNLSVNGQTQIPPGFRFHPTEDELLSYYLTKKVASEKIDLDVIREVDLNKHEPWEFQEMCKIGSTTQNDWYMFSHKDKKYPSGTRTNRATTAGFWKATGRDKIIFSSGTRIGLRKTLVFYMGRAPQGQKTSWIMHEYRLDDSMNIKDLEESTSESMKSNEDGWVVCRVFRKKNYEKTLKRSKIISSSSSPSDSQKQIILSSSNIEDPNPIRHLDESNHNKKNIQSSAFDDEQTVNDMFFKVQNRQGMEDWVKVDQFVASQLNCDLTDYQLPYDQNLILDGIELPYNDIEDDFWSSIKTRATPSSSSSPDILHRLLA